MKKHLILKKYPCHKLLVNEGTAYTHRANIKSEYVARQGRAWTLYTPTDDGETDYSTPVRPIDGGVLLSAEQSKQLIGAIQRVLHAASDDETRPHMACVVMRRTGAPGALNTWHVYATDAHRIARSTSVHAPSDTVLPSEIVIPVAIAKALVNGRRTIRSVAIAATSGLGQLVVDSTDDGIETVVWETDHYSPDPSKIFSKDRIDGVMVETDDLLSALDDPRLKPTSRQDSLHLDLCSGELSVSLNGHGERVTFMRKYMVGYDVRLSCAVNPKYLKDALKAIHKDVREIMISQTDPLDPIHVYDGSTFEEIEAIMPMRK